MKKAIIVFSLLFMPVAALAFAVKSDNNIYLPKDQVIEGSYYVAGQSIVIDGKIKGDLFCAGQTINITGSIDGDVLCVGENIVVKGDVGGNIRIAGSYLNIENSVTKNVSAFGVDVNLGQDAVVGGEMLNISANSKILGKISKDLYGVGGNLFIDGEIGGNIRYRLDKDVRKLRQSNNLAERGSNLILADGAIVSGDVVYTAIQDASVAANAKVAGKIIRNEQKIAITKHASGPSLLYSVFYKIFGLLVIGLTLLSLWHEQIKKITDKMLENIPAVFGWGAVVLFLTPIVFILLLFTVIGIPLAIIILLIWIIAILIAKVLTGIFLGRSIVEKLWQNQKDSLSWAMVIGIVVSGILFSLPIFGWVFSLVALLWGMGGIWLYLKKNE
jgi:cytoskeletal protein CcmA (bactofilin family)